ncbi:MAG: sulfatase [Planctomycetaceae bacterium]
MVRFAGRLIPVVLALVWTSSPESCRAAPNVIIFYADDLGWGELGCQGNPQIPTPHIDSLAANGVRCTQGYVAATYCSPSRAGLLSGRYPTRFGHETNGDPNTSGFIEETTLADRLKSLGYATSCVGKWHLGDLAERRPMARGFDEFFGTLANTPFFHPTKFIDSRKSPEVAEVADDAFYTTDAYAERATEWIESRASKPWFLYLPFNAQHAPLQATQKYLDRFKEIPGDKRRLFAAMLSAMDDAVGRVLSTVRKIGQEDNTLIFFIADNGGPTQGTTSQNGPLRGFKMTTFEGGIRVPFLVQWKGTIDGGRTYDLPVMNLDVVPTVMAAAGKPLTPGDAVDGVDLVPFFTGRASGRPHDAMFWRFIKQWAVRSGDWKLVVSNGGSGRAELYDLSQDVGEQNDLAARQPERVAELAKLYEAWSRQQAPARTEAEQPGKKQKKRRQTAA